MSGGGSAAAESEDAEEAREAAAAEQRGEPAGGGGQEALPVHHGEGVHRLRAGARHHEGGLTARCLIAFHLHITI